MVQFRNLVLEGGGVKGLGYISAMQYMNNHGYLNDITRGGGTSAGAINALLFALGLDIQQQWDEMQQLDFNKFKDCPWGCLEGFYNLFSKYGWYKGDFFYQWIRGLIKKSLGNEDATFNNLREAGKELYVISTNLSTGYAEVFSHERHPNMPVAVAVRMSMSIPLFFVSKRFNRRRDLFVDGGVVLNYPVKLFDREKYILPRERFVVEYGADKQYYPDHNSSLKNESKTQSISPYIYNKQTLGMRLDTQEEIGLYRYDEPIKGKPINSFKEYVGALIKTMMLAQDNQHLHSDDWQRTVYINCLEVKVTDFDITDVTKQKLIQSGFDCAKVYFDWFTDPKNIPANRIRLKVRQLQKKQKDGFSTRPFSLSDDIHYLSTMRNYSIQIDWIARLYRRKIPIPYTGSV